MLLSLLAASVLTSAPVQKLREFALKLDVGDPQMYVLDNLGTPDGNTMRACGEKTAQPWPCLVWTYKSTDSTQYLDVIFREEADGTWSVATWIL